MPNFPTLAAFRANGDGELPSHIWPGGYPAIYYTKDGLIVCAPCAEKADTGDPAIAADVYYEGPTLQCDDCNADIESAYGDPDATEETSNA